MTLHLSHLRVDICRNMLSAMYFLVVAGSARAGHAVRRVTVQIAEGHRVVASHRLTVSRGLPLELEQTWTCFGWDCRSFSPTFWRLDHGGDLVPVPPVTSALPVLGGMALGVDVDLGTLTRSSYSGEGMDLQYARPLAFGAATSSFPST